MQIYAHIFILYMSMTYEKHLHAMHCTPMYFMMALGTFAWFFGKVAKQTQDSHLCARENPDSLGRVFPVQPGNLSPL